MEYIRVFDNVIPKDLCEKIIDSFEKDERVKPDGQPEYSTRRMLFLSDKKEWMNIVMNVTALTNDLIDQYFARPDEYAETRPADWIDDGYVMACYDEGDICALHADGQCAEAPYNGHRIATVIFFLNDVEEGGETYFPLQDKKIKPVRGRVVIFPPDYMHPHEVLAPKTKRYIVQTWITDSEMVVCHREY